MMLTGASHHHDRGSEEEKHDVFSAMLDAPMSFLNDARSSSMSTMEKLVSASDDEKRNEKSVWYE